MPKAKLQQIIYVSFFLSSYLLSKIDNSPSILIIIMSMFAGNYIGTVFCTPQKIKTSDKKKQIKKLDYLYILISLAVVFSWEYIFELIFDEILYPDADIRIVLIKILAIIVGFFSSIIVEKIEPKNDKINAENES